MARTLASLAAFQIIWLVTVIGAARGWDLLGPALLLAWSPVHLLWLARGLHDFAPLSLATFAGGSLDSLLVWAGWVAFPNAPLTIGPEPLWMLALWVNFALTLNHCLAWLKSRLALAALLGALGGPLAYLAGSALGAITLAGNSTGTLMFVGLGYLVITPALVAVATRTQPDPPDGSPEPARGQATA